MKTRLLNACIGTTAVLSFLVPPMSHAAMLAYESFNYLPGSNVLSGQNTAAGFSGVWRDISGGFEW